MIKGDEVSESAKAVQEVAKTTKAGIEITEKFGNFVSRIIGEPIDEAVGMLTDKLRYSRWERRERLKDQANKFIAERNVKEELRPVPPKIALPVIENASLEDNDELQDIWAQFIASAVDPNFDGTLRTAFIDIIKQLEVVDIHILNLIYENYKTENQIQNKIVSENEHLDLYELAPDSDSNFFPIDKALIINQLKICEITYKESIDNLIRVRCICSYISNETIEMPYQDQYGRILRASSFVELARLSGGETVNFNITYIYDKVCITSLGISFAKACMRSKTENDSKVD